MTHDISVDPFNRSSWAKRVYTPNVGGSCPLKQLYFSLTMSS